MLPKIFFSNSRYFSCDFFDLLKKCISTNIQNIYDLLVNFNTFRKNSQTLANDFFTLQAATPAEPKLGSPFYAEPADAIKQAALKRRAKPPVFTPQPSIRNRHSDPTLLHQWPPTVAGGVLERIDSKEELITNGSFSSSVDNLVALRKSRRSNGSIASSTKTVKPVEPPKITQNRGKYSDATWAVDSSWEFIGKRRLKTNGTSMM